ncbi:MAG TPA: hypothetical protein VJT67_05700 [Longimicrobiaceae bacterium]|nr:hypothetical protein [Longimicrobiaceae bacterium]
MITLIQRRVAAVGLVLLLSACGNAEHDHPPAPDSALTRSESAPDHRSAANTGQATVVVHLTGLLLLVPQTDVMQGQQHSGNLPLHVLMPATGIDAPAHVAQIAWKSTAEECSEPDTFWMEFCWASLDGMSVEIGSGGLPAANAAIRPGGSVVVADRPQTLRRAVFNNLFSDHPPRRLRARVSLLAGQVAETCKIGVWRFGTREDSVTSVLTWKFEINPDSIRTLTLTEFREDPEAPTRSRTVRLPPVANGGTLELLVVYMPLTELRLGHGETVPQPTPDTTRATHLNAAYHLLGITPREEDIPVFVKGDGQCEMGPYKARSLLNPSSPTCMLAFAFPPPT